MCNLSEGVLAKGIEQGMAILKIPETEQQKYMDLLGKQDGQKQ